MNNQNQFNMMPNFNIKNSYDVNANINNQYINKAKLNKKSTLENL